MLLLLITVYWDDFAAWRNTSRWFLFFELITAGQHIACSVPICYDLWWKMLSLFWYALCCIIFRWWSSFCCLRESHNDGSFWHPYESQLRDGRSSRPRMSGKRAPLFCCCYRSLKSQSGVAFPIMEALGIGPKYRESKLLLWPLTATMYPSVTWSKKG